MKNNKVVLAFSGGLDTSYCAKYLSKTKGLAVYSALVNTGGFTPEELQLIEERAYALGVQQHQLLEKTEEFYEHILKYLIFGNVLRNNTYPLSVSAERIVQAIEIINYAKEIGAKYIAHGSTGAGNDQVRFDMIFQIIAPEIEIITPIRDKQLSRQEEIDYLKANGVEMNWEKSKYSVNKGLWGTSVGGAETLTSHEPLPESAFPSQLLEKEVGKISLSFTKGELTAINDKEDSPENNIQILEEIAKKYAIGRDIHVGDTIIGIKGRVGFEAASASIIIKAHHLLEKHTLSKWQLQHKDYVANWYGTHLHEGQYLDPVMRDFEALLQSSQERVTGKVFVSLHPYRFVLDGISSPYDLMNSNFGNYGEENKAWTANDAKGFIKILSNAGKIYQSVENN